MGSPTANGPRVTLKVGDDVLALTGSCQHYVVIALAAFAKQQVTRAAEAVRAGNVGHADQRAKARKMVEDVLEFFKECGVELPDWYRRSDSPLPSEQA